MTLTPALEELARGHRILALEGHEEVVLGHLSWRDPQGRGFWIKQAGLGMAEIAGPDDLVLIGFDGAKRAGAGECHQEWPLHGEIYLARPDVHAVGHTHAFYATLFAATRETLRAVALAGAYFQENVPRYTGTAHLVATRELGRDVAEALGGAFAVFMRNHGVTFCGRSLPHCVLLGYFLERACRQQLALNASGIPWAGQNEEEVATKGPRLLTEGYIASVWAYLGRKLAAYERSGTPLV